MDSGVPAADGYEFTNDWFKPKRRDEWTQLFRTIDPHRLLEIGSYEGASACFLIDHLAVRHALELHCIDTWEGGVEHKDVGTDMAAVEARFDRNVAKSLAAAAHPVSFVKHKGPSLSELARLVAAGASGRFDFIYIDGSHLAQDVLADAVLALDLLKVGGMIVFDDYLWAEDLDYGRDPLRTPKIAVDAFVNINFRRVRVVSAPLYQVFVQKMRP